MDIIKTYNPDILTCLANLSNDEVFTPPHIANQMLDTLPVELWSNPDAKFLDPFSKSGVFLREIAKRLLEGLKPQIPNLQERIDHIMHHQLYGIGITELTAYITRRSLYCSTRANGDHSVSHFDTEQGNIFYQELAHTFERGKCIYCGINDKELNEENREGRNQFAYPFIHNKNPYENMKFDVIIGNPPYQMSDGGGTGDSAKPIYHLFIEQATKLEPHYLCMIVPSRWMKGGKGLKNFRENMIKDVRISKIYDYEDSSEIFTGVKIDGGICYFLWDKTHNAEVEYYYKSKEGDEIYSKRFLKTEISETVIRDFRQYSIIQKVGLVGEDKFNSIVLSRKPYGIGADFFNSPENYLNVKRSEKPLDQYYKIYGVKGKKGTKRVVGYIYNGDYIKNKDYAKSYKLFFSKAFSTTATVPPEIIVSKPNEICTETFLNIGKFDSEKNARNALTYIKTKFFRGLLYFNRHSLNISQESFALIPLQDFSKPWTDEELYKKYNLSQEEIDYIENLIDVME